MQRFMILQYYVAVVHVARRNRHAREWVYMFLFYESSLTTALMCLPFGVVRVRGTRSPASSSSSNSSPDNDKSESYSSWSSRISSSTFMSRRSCRSFTLYAVKWNVPAENLVVCCLTVSCRTHCPCALAHYLIFTMLSLSMETTGMGFNFGTSPRSIATSGTG